MALRGLWSLAAVLMGQGCPAPAVKVRVLPRRTTATNARLHRARGHAGGADGSPGGVAADRPAERKIAIVLFNFPPNAGNTGTAAYLSVFESLHRTLAAMKREGYQVDLPPMSTRFASVSWLGMRRVSAPMPMSTPGSRPAIMFAAKNGCARSRRNGGRRPASNRATALDLRAR